MQFKMETDSVIRNFQNFLMNSWRSVADTLTDDATLSDWMQANWEILVESLLCPKENEYLAVYGDGADCNGVSSRVWKPNVVATHQICVKLKDNAVDQISGERISVRQTDQIIFDQFVSWDGKQYGSDMPFDHALLSLTERDLIIACDALIFDTTSIIN